MSTTDLGQVFDRQATAEYIRHHDQLRGAIRHEVVMRNVLQYLGPNVTARPLQVLDVGGGDGVEALMLAGAGHHVTLIDQSKDMIDAAQDRFEKHSDAIREVGGQAVCVAVGLEDYRTESSDKYDLVLCHGVLMYQTNIQGFLNLLIDRLTDFGTLSLLTKNRAALAMRAGFEGRYEDAVKLFESSQETNRFGAETVAHSVDELSRLLFAGGALVQEWFGVRVMTDDRGDEPRPDDDNQFETMVQAELIASRTDPYRQIGRLVHVLARRADAVLAEVSERFET